VHADSHFTIGRNHLNNGKPCQDYATAADLPGGGAYAIVSDGCSTGGETDVGSRILTLSTAQAIREHWSTSRTTHTPGTTDHIAVRQRVVSAAACSVLGCQPSDMYATCIYIYASRDGGFAHIQGDGVVAWKYTDGRVGMVRYDWANNMPFYPAYADDNYRQFIDVSGGDINTLRVTSQTWEQSAPEADLVHVDSRSYSLGQGIRGLTIPLPPGVRFFGVFTDGVTLVQEWDWKAVVTELLDFPTTKGAFAKRQLIWFVRDTQGIGKGPFDDLAYAVIDLEGEEVKR
jgi:hypothetical protein